MPQAIQVKYLPPTNCKGARFSVKTAARTKIYNEPVNSFSVERNAQECARKFASDMGWSGTYYGGQLKNGDHVFVVVVDWCIFKT